MSDEYQECPACPNEECMGYGSNRFVTENEEGNTKKYHCTICDHVFD